MEAAFTSMCAPVIPCPNGAPPLRLQEALDIDGKVRKLSEFAGKVTLVVNVASACGYTDENYKGEWATVVLKKKEEEGTVASCHPGVDMDTACNVPWLHGRLHDIAFIACHCCWQLPYVSNIQCDTTSHRIPHSIPLRVYQSDALPILEDITLAVHITTIN